MNLSGERMIMEGDKYWFGVSHNVVVEYNGKDYLIFNWYDAAYNGRSKLRIEKITWINDWPFVSWRAK